MSENRDRGDAPDLITNLRRQLEEARARERESAKDAERFRFLLQSPAACNFYMNQFHTFSTFYGDVCAAIDAAIASEKGERT